MLFVELWAFWETFYPEIFIVADLRLSYNYILNFNFHIFRKMSAINDRIMVKAMYCLVWLNNICKFNGSLLAANIIIREYGCQWSYRVHITDIINHLNQTTNACCIIYINCAFHLHNYDYEDTRNIISTYFRFSSLKFHLWFVNLMKARILIHSIKHTSVKKVIMIYRTRIHKIIFYLSCTFL